MKARASTRGYDLLHLWEVRFENADLPERAVTRTVCMASRHWEISDTLLREARGLVQEWACHARQDHETFRIVGVLPIQRETRILMPTPAGRGRQ
ncbi:MAG: hypothetical protein HY699_12975 [Deltaproteobacteria bacterium]|nr:hypothetical protein [Deltaproteobacteria bacterium]